MSEKEVFDYVDKYMLDDKEYQSLVKKLEKRYEQDPVLVKDSLREMIRSIDREIKHGKQEEYVSMDDGTQIPLTKEELYKYITMLIFIAAIGLLNIPGIGMYIFGFVFFAAGLNVGMFVPAFGIIFLFSHGMTGLGLMCSALIGDAINSPLMQDNPQNLYIYLGICILVGLFATLSAIKLNLGIMTKGKSPSVLTIAGAYMIMLLMVALFPKLMPFIYSL